MRRVENSEGRVPRAERRGVDSVFGLRFSALSALAFFLSVTPILGAAPTPAQLQYFENNVRPILSENCYKCHSQAEGKVKGGLELDWKGGWEQGSDSGSVIEPGDPDHSVLITAIRYSDPDLQMPPKDKKLSVQQISVLENWVKMGAPDPRETRPSGSIETLITDTDHWAFQPVKNPVPPSVKNVNWVNNEIDQFILAKLESNGLQPNETADRRTLIRRAYFDLVGLPPTPDEFRSFVVDESPDAFEKVIDKLLASPHYGERWGRHWLDVARYSDTKGQFNRNREDSMYPHAWTYRDYVIQAFNDDKPYDQFIVEQLAADQLKLGKDKSALAALGFLTVGDHFNGMVNDIINDRIDVTTKAFQGMTVSCARCHDHKFDPIPTKDYYALHGIFNSSAEPSEMPVIKQLGSTAEQNDYQMQLLDLEVKMDALVDSIVGEYFGDYRKSSAVYLYALSLPEKERAAYLEKNGADASLLRNWQRLVQYGARGEYGVFTAFNYLMRLSDMKFSQTVPRMYAGLSRNNGAKKWNPSVYNRLIKTKPQSKGELAVAYGNLIAGRDKSFNETMEKLVDETGLRVVRGRKQNQYRTLREQMASLELIHPGASGRAMVLYDLTQPKDSPVFIRGEANNKGDVVPRRYLEVLGGSDARPFTIGSGRLELARSIIDEKNPLTARVMVNRVWQHHFGTGFVPTPDDLGTQSEPPSHPELLDYLSSKFMANDWSLKKLHKEILMSAAWQQSSDTHQEYAEKDPFNKLLWRANIRRLEFEPLRDSILYVGGQLDTTMGGKPVDISEGTHVTQRRYASALTRPGSVKMSQDHRRSVYGYVDRSDVMEMMYVFDFASPDMPTGRRYETTVPQQALFLMNSPLVIEQAKNVVHREEFAEIDDDMQRIVFLYELFFQRLPNATETKLGSEFVAVSNASKAIAENHPNAKIGVTAAGQVKKNSKKSWSAHPPKSIGAWAEYAHALLMTDEAFFVN